MSELEIILNKLDKIEQIVSEKYKPEKEWLTIKEIAERDNVSRSTVYQGKEYEVKMLHGKMRARKKIIE